MEINLNRYINSVGKTTFIYCFELFMNEYNKLNEYALGDRIPLYDPTAATNTRESLKMKASFSSGIFRAGREKEALEICINAKKITNEVRLFGQNIYQKYYLLGSQKLREVEQESGYSYQTAVQNAQININKIKQIKENPEKKNNNHKTNKQISNNRSLQTAKESLYLAGFSCELDPAHKTFISKSTNNNFVEAHHLIPMAYEDNFENNIDVHSNIVALCPNCHRAIHNATDEEKKRMISVLYEKRKNRLQKQGIIIDLESLCSLYR